LLLTLVGDVVFNLLLRDCKLSSFDGDPQRLQPGMAKFCRDFVELVL
jgi:hypothetical protein